MKKRVGVARGICMKPEILLYDEPTTGLDPIMSDAINELILSLHDRLKITSIVVTHDMVSAYKVGTRVAMMYHGNIIEIGKPEIENYQVGMRGVDRIHAGCPRRRLDDGRMMIAQSGANGAPDVHLVFDDEQSVVGGSGSRHCRTMNLLSQHSICPKAIMNRRKRPRVRQSPGVNRRAFQRNLERAFRQYH
jgi:ABC-type multidrug transport system ATPase subunit